MVRHHELCFGCGRTNLFGLALEAERREPHTVEGRCFIKQDHQGPDRGFAHEGVIAASLIEAIVLAAGPEARIRRVEIEFLAPVPVGTFLDVRAGAETAAATSDGVVIARAAAADIR